MEKRSDHGRKFPTRNIARSERVRTPESGSGKRTSGTAIPTIEKTSVRHRNAGQLVILTTGVGGGKTTRGTRSAIANSKPSAIPGDERRQRPLTVAPPGGVGAIAKSDVWTAETTLDPGTYRIVPWVGRVDCKDGRVISENIYVISQIEAMSG